MKCRGLAWNHGQWHGEDELTGGEIGGVFAVAFVAPSHFTLCHELGRLAALAIDKK